MNNWSKRLLALILILCLSVSGIAVYAVEETGTEDAEDVLYTDEILEEAAVSEDAGLLLNPEAAEETDDPDEASADDFSEDPVSDEDLIIDEEDFEVLEAAAEEAGTEETETEEAEAETKAEETEAETETEAESETESETETEEPLIEVETETGTEESTELAAEYKLWINGIQVTSENRNDPTGDGTFYLDTTDMILKIKRSFTGSSGNDVINNGIDGLIIEVAEGTEVTLTSSSRNVIYSSGSLMIRGGGTLHLICGGSNTNFNGIYFVGNWLNIQDVTLTAAGGEWGITGPSYNNGKKLELEIQNANVTADSSNGAICDFYGGITLSGCGITIPSNGMVNGKDIISESSGARVSFVEIEANDTTYYPLWVGGIKVSEKNKNDILGDGGKAKYDPENAILTLNNPYITGAHTYNTYHSQKFQAAIYAETSDLTIKGSLRYSGPAFWVIDVRGNLTLDANLELQKLECLEGYGADLGGSGVILAKGNILVNSGTLKLTALDKASDYGLAAHGSITVGNAKIEANLNIDADQSLIVNGGTITSDTYIKGYAGISFNSATVTAPLGISTSNHSCDLTIRNSTITVPGFANSYGNLETRGNLVIENSKITIEGGKNSRNLCSYYGSVAIKGSTVNLQGARGIYSKKGVSVENSTLNLSVSTDTASGTGAGHGIYSDGTITITGTGSKITAEGSVTALWGKTGIQVDSRLFYKEPANAVLGDLNGGKAVFSAGKEAKRVVILLPADYSKVTAALAKIPSNLSLYTDATVKKVTDAKAAVTYGLDSSQQSKVDAMAATIENAVKGLVYKPADYSKVDAALKKIPSDLSIYTAASVKKVTDAKAAVKRGYNITRQSEVNAMAAAIENAIKGLVRKPVCVKLVAAYNGAHGIGVKWIKCAGATEYTIWQKYKGVWRSIKTVKPNDKTLQDVGTTLMYTDHTVKTGYGKGYIYSVSAKVGSKYVDYDKAGVAIYRLNPPILKKAVSTKAGTATVTWKGVFGRTETNGGYNLQYITEEDAKAKKWSWKSVPQKLGHTTTSTTVTGLEKGKKYVFRIRCSKTNKDRGTFYSEYSPWLSVNVK